METSQKTFVPFQAVTLNANILLDPNLTDAESRIIAIAYCLRSEIQHANSPDHAEDLLKKITVSRFSEPRGKTRDHVRKQINKMLTNEHVKKYLKMFVLKNGNNSEWLIRLNFNDNLPDSMNLSNVSEGTDSLAKELQLLDCQNTVLIQHYINNIKKLSPEFFDTPIGLIKLIGTTGKELINGLFYLLQRMKVKKIDNPKGYLKSCFDQTGKFKYQVQPIKYFPQDQKVTTQDFFEFQINKKTFHAFESKFLKDNKKHTFLYREDETTIFLSHVRRAGRELNIKSFLKRNDVPFQIVKDYTIEETEQ